MTDITITIPNAKVAQYRDWFLAYNPIPLDPATGQPAYTALAWIKRCLKEYLLQQCKGGENKLRIEALAASQILDDDIT